MFKINDLVWGKLGGYDYWPAQIIDPAVKEEKEKPGQYCVQFIASKTYTFLSHGSIFDYKSNREKYTKCFKSVRKCGAAYKKAIQLAEEYLDVIEMEELCGSCCVEYLRVCVDPARWHEELTGRLLALQKSGTLTDIVMWDGRGIQLPLHSTVLAACSTFWQNVFRETSSDNIIHAFSAKCSPLNKDVWEAIINLMYTGITKAFKNMQQSFIGDVIQQMTSMKLDILLDYIFNNKENSQRWQQKLCETLYSYQQDNKLTNLILVHHSQQDQEIQCLKAKAVNTNMEIDVGQDSTDCTMKMNVSGSGSGSSSSSSSSLSSCRAHMLVFMAASDYLRNRFASSAVLGKYKLGLNANRRMWRNLVEFIYTGSTEVAQSDITDLGKIARKLEIPMMCEAIEHAPNVDQDMLMEVVLVESEGEDEVVEMMEKENIENENENVQKSVEVPV